MVERVCADLGETFVEVSIDDDPALLEEYGEEIPVTLVDGRRHDFFRVDESRLRAALIGWPRRRPRCARSRLTRRPDRASPGSVCSHVHKRPRVAWPNGTRPGVNSPDPPAGDESLDRQDFQRDCPRHPRGDRRAAPRLPAGADHPQRGRHDHLLQRGARRGRGRQQRQAPQGPLLPRQLRHPRRRLRRRLPALPDRPRDRGHPGLARGHRRHRQPGACARQLLGLPQPRLPRRRAARRRPRAAPARSSRASTSAPSTTSSRSWPSKAWRSA